MLSVFSVSMNMKKLRLVCWNVRGLGCAQKCNVVRNPLVSSRCDVCLFQETKINESYLNYFVGVLPTYFSPDCVILHAINLAGGCLIAWRRNYTLINSWTTRHSISALLRQESSGALFVITNVYGPSNDALKQ